MVIVKIERKGTKMAYFFILSFRPANYLLFI